MASQPKIRVTVEEYLTGERKAEHKSEFLSGEMFSITPSLSGYPGASFTHNLIVTNIVAELRNQLRGSPCRAVASDLRIQVALTGLYTYPDVVVVCGEPQFADVHLDTLVNPQLIVEVLSPSTEAYDRGEKFAHYRRLESLTDYVLVALDKVRVEHYARQGERWVFSEVSDVSGMLRPSSPNCAIALQDIYDGIVFPPLE